MNRFIVLLLIICFQITSCMHQASTAENAESIAESSKSEEAPVSNASLPTDPFRKLIKSADFRFECEDVRNTNNQIEESLAHYGAYISDSRLSTHNGRVEQTCSIKVPAGSFDDLVRTIDALAPKPDHRSITVSDASKEFVDLESRIKTKRDVQDRYQAILRTKTGKIEEVLAAERQIGEIQEEIEAAVSRLNYLKDRVSFSTIQLQFYQYTRIEAVAPPNPVTTRLREAFASGMIGIMETLIAIVHIWPLIIIGAIAATIVARKRRRSAAI